MITDKIGKESQWAELPRKDETLPEFGLKRGLLLKLCATGVIWSVLIKDKNATRGKRLVNIPSLREYITGLPTNYKRQA